MEIHNFPPDSVKAALAATRDDRDPLSVEARRYVWTGWSGYGAAQRNRWTGLAGSHY